MSVKSAVRSDASPDEAVTAPEPFTSKSIWSAWRRLVRTRSLSRVQAMIGTLAGIASIVTVALPLVQSRPANTGELVAIVQAAGTRQAVPDATVEVLTTQNALVATLTPDTTGRAMQKLREGVYLVRVTHPRYAAEVRRIQVLPRHTVEVRASLRAGSSSSVSVDHAVNGTFNAIRRALRF